MGNPIRVEPVLPKARLALVLGAGGILVILLGGLLLTFYSMQIDLEQKAREHVLSRAKSVSHEIGFFFSERRDDLRDIADSPHFAAALESGAGESDGHSGSFGALSEIVRLMASTLEWERLDERRVFSRLAICDAQGNLLAGTGGGNLALQTIWPAISHGGEEPEAEGGEERLRVHYVREEFSVAVFLPYRRNGRIEAYVIGWIPQDLLHEKLLLPNWPEGGHIWLFHGDTPILFNDGESAFFSQAMTELQQVRTAIPVEYSISSSGRMANRQIGLRIPIPGVSLAVVYSVPREEVLGRVSPGALLFVLMLISLAVLGGVVGALRYSGAI
jgi:hypothetical protein